MSSIRRSRLRDEAELAEMAVQVPRRASLRWRTRLADRGSAAISASGKARLRCAVRVVLKFSSDDVTSRPVMQDLAGPADDGQR